MFERLRHLRFYRFYRNTQQIGYFPVLQLPKTAQLEDRPALNRQLVQRLSQSVFQLANLRPGRGRLCRRLRAAV